MKKINVSFKAISKLPTVGDVIKLDKEIRKIVKSPKKFDDKIRVKRRLK